MRAAPTRKTLHNYINAHVKPGAQVFTDEHQAYAGLLNHKAVKHSVGEYVKDQAHTNGIESFGHCCDAATMAPTTR